MLRSPSDENFHLKVRPLPVKITCRRRGRDRRRFGGRCPILIVWVRAKATRLGACFPSRADQHPATDGDQRGRQQAEHSRSRSADRRDVVDCQVGMSQSNPSTPISGSCGFMSSSSAPSTRRPTESNELWKGGKRDACPTFPQLLLLTTWKGSARTPVERINPVVHFDGLTPPLSCKPPHVATPPRRGSRCD